MKVKSYQYRVLFLVLIIQFIVTGINAQKNDSIYNGLTKFYYSNNQVSSEGNMIDGKPNGYWKTFYDSGVLKSEGNRISFQLDGLWVFYNNKGDTTEKIYFRNGEKNGYNFKFSYDTISNIKLGYISSKELYVRGKKQNKSYYYFDNDSVFQIVNYINNRKNKLTKEFNRKGDLITIFQYRNNIIINKDQINRSDDRGFKQGVWRKYFSNDRLKWEAHYLNNELHGYSRQYDIRGQLIINKQYNNGKLVETPKRNEVKSKLQKEFFSNGKIRFSGSYCDTIPVGIHREYNENSKIIASKIYDDFGNLISIGIISNDEKKLGKWKNFYVSGIVRSEGLYKSGRKSGKWVYYFENSEIEQKGNFRNGRYDGLWQWYYDTGELKRKENYYSGREDGICIEYSKLGDILETGEYIDGLKEGEWVNNVGNHYEKGVYKFGLREGEWIYYYLNDNIKFKGNFIQGNEDEKHKWYYENGTLKEEKYFVFGSREKIWKFYSEDGILFMTITYRNDKEIKINGKKIDN